MASFKSPYYNILHIKPLFLKGWSIHGRKKLRMLEHFFATENHQYAPFQQQWHLFRADLNLPIDCVVWPGPTIWSWSCLLGLALVQSHICIGRRSWRLNHTATQQLCQDFNAKEHYQNWAAGFPGTSPARSRSVSSVCFAWCFNIGLAKAPVKNWIRMKLKTIVNCKQLPDHLPKGLWQKHLCGKSSPNWKQAWVKTTIYNYSFLFQAYFHRIQIEYTTNLSAIFFWITPQKSQLSNEKNPDCLGYIIGDYTTQLYRDYNKPLQGSLLSNQYNGK